MIRNCVKLVPTTYKNVTNDVIYRWGWVHSLYMELKGSRPQRIILVEGEKIEYTPYDLLPNSIIDNKVKN